MFILYALAVVVNSLPAVVVELPSVFPDEINVAGIAALYSGRNWSGLLEQINGTSGYIQAVFYAPLFSVIKSPYVLYKAMLIENALIVGFIPTIVYHLAGKFGVISVRRKLLISICCGMYVAYTINSKFIWNEPLTCLLSWILTLVLFSAWDKCGRGSKAASSVLAGFLCALAYASNKRLISIVLALILTVIIARILFKVKILNLPVFAITLAVSFCAEFFLRGSIEQMLWGGASELGSEISINTNAARRFFGVLFSHIYAFMTSSVGMGALAVAIFVIMMLSYLFEGVKDRSKTLEDGTKVYEPIKHRYSTRLTIFALYQFLAVGITASASAFFTFGTGRYTEESLVFGRYTDNIAPFAVFLVLVYIFLYGIDLVKPLIGIVVYGYSCLCFYIVGYPLASSTSSFMYSPLFGLYSLVTGEESSDSTGMSFIVLSSLVFSLYALIIVFISCTRRHRVSLVSGTILCVLMAAVIYNSALYLPNISKKSSERLAPCKEIVRMIYNDAQSPPILAYDIDAEIAATIQFLAPDTRVKIVNDGKRITDSCLLITKSDMKVPFEGGTYDIIGRTNEYTVYAYGESARDFIRYNSAEEKKGQLAEKGNLQTVE